MRDLARALSCCPPPDPPCYGHVRRQVTAFPPRINLTSHAIRVADRDVMDRDIFKGALARRWSNTALCRQVIGGPHGAGYYQGLAIATS